MLNLPRTVSVKPYLNLGSIHETLVTVLLSLLGLGAMRTAEKIGGRAR